MSAEAGAAASAQLVRELVHGRWKAQALEVTLRLGLADAQSF